MREGWLVVAWVELLGEHIERIRVLAKISNVENRFGSGEIETGEVGIETGARRAKIGYCRQKSWSTHARDYVRDCGQPPKLTSSSSTEACARHDNNLGCFAIFDELCNGCKTALLEFDGRSAIVKHGLVVTHSPVLLAVFGFVIGLRPFLLVTSFALATYFDGLQGERQM